MLKSSKEKKQISMRAEQSADIIEYRIKMTDKERLEALKKELELLKSFGFGKSELKTVADFYNSHINMELNNVSKCVKLLAKYLKVKGKTDEEIDKYLAKHKNAYFNSYAALEKRMQIFKKCNCLEKVVTDHSSLLSANNHSINDTQAIYEYAKRCDYKINLEEMAYYMQTNKSLKLLK